MNQRSLKSVSPEDLKVASNIACYVSSKYGGEQLGLLRLVCGSPFVRDCETFGDFSRVLELPMISFEKILRESTGVYYTKNGNKFAVYNRGGLVREFTDDNVFSVSGAVVSKIASLYPEFSSFGRLPLVSLGTGRNVSDILASVNLEAIGGIKAHLNDYYDDFESIYDNLTSLVEARDPVAPYSLVELLHNTFVQLRLNIRDFGGMVGEPLSFASDSELGAVMFGRLKKSVEKPPAPFIAGLLELFPGAKMVDGDLIMYGDFDPFVYVGSTSLNLDIDLNAEIAPLPSMPQAPVSPVVVNTATVSLEDKVDPTIQAGIDHVLHWISRDINKLPRDQEIIALYGSEPGFDLYSHLSKSFLSSLIRVLPKGTYRADFVIQRLLEKVQEEPAATDYNDETLALFCGGRLISWKGQWSIKGGSWIRKC